MRVVAGTARGIRLGGPPSEATRPISDRAKEALFNIFGTRVRGARFLDLFAGTGAVGIEALSRGAAEAVFVERDPAVVEVIDANLAKARLAGRATVARADVFRWLEGAGPRGSAGPAGPGPRGGAGGSSPMDIVFAGPPQWQELWGRSLAAIDGRPSILAPGATVVLQLDPREEAGEPALVALELVDVRRYGNVALRFYSLA